MRTSLASILTVFLLILSPSAWGADVTKGQDAYNSGDYQTAIAEWQPLAESGDAEAQFGMGLLYANGFGDPSMTTRRSSGMGWPPSSSMPMRSAISP